MRHQSSGHPPTAAIAGTTSRRDVPPIARAARAIGADAMEITRRNWLTAPIAAQSDGNRWHGLVKAGRLK